MRTSFKRTVLVAALMQVTLIDGVAFAQQQLPDISDALRQIPVLPPQPAAPDLPAIGNMPPMPAPMTSVPGETLLVSRIEIDGNRVLPTGELLPLVADAVGKSLTLSQLEELASKITRHYRASGYFVARAYLPAQEVAQGVVRIQVVEGRYGKFVVDNTSLAGDWIVQGQIDQAKRDGTVSQESLEGAMFAVNEIPGVVIRRADVRPGDQVGTSDFYLDTAATARATGYVAAENYGSEYTGKRRLSAGVSVNSPFGIGDRLSASGLISNGADLSNYRLAYSAPLTPQGLRAEAALARTDYALAGGYAPLDAVGRAETAELTLTYPFVRRQSRVVEASLNVAHRELTDEIRSISARLPKTANVATVSLLSRSRDNLFDLPGETVMLGSVTLGDLDVKDAAARAQDGAGARTDGRYGKLNLTLSRLVQLKPSLTLSGSLRLQHALFNKNLDGSEDMSISGISSVKVYPPGEFAAENAALLNTELLYAVPMDSPLSLKVGVFADIGHARQQNRFGNQGGSRTLSDAGLSLYANYGRFFGTLQVARRLSREASSESMPSTRALVQVGSVF
jgi:hemolysin activation/secretion protein